jgi:predicted lipoprotein
MRISRRDWLKAWSLAPLAGACSRARTRKDVLRALVVDLATEDMRAIDATSRDLSESLRAAIDGPEPARLEAARSAWKKAVLAWRRASCFQTVPLVKSNALLRATFFPVRASAVESLALSGKPLSDKGVSELGVDQKGLFALEVLLFGAPEGVDAPLGERLELEGVRVRELAHLLGANVAECALAAARELGDGEAFAETYANAGQESLNRLVSQMVGVLGSIASGRLSKALLPDGQSRPSEIEGYSSGSAIEILSALVSGVERLYRGGAGGGIADLVQATSAAVDQRVRDHFSRALSALERVRQSRAGRAEPELANTAREAMRALDRLFETELASALGVTLMFAGPDAD